jgi:hypothetical protein
MTTRPTLDELAHLEMVPELWTDKKSLTPGYTCHDYLRLYDREFSKWRDEPIRLMEIGLNKGASIKLWLQYFTKASVLGVDIVNFESGVGELDSSRFTFVRGDQSDTVFWSEFCGKQQPFDIIIDDGCHFSGPIHTAFRSLWLHVKPGGYYIVEDISEVKNPDSRTVGFPNQLEFIQNLVEPVVLGMNDVDEMMVSKDLVILKKK